MNNNCFDFDTITALKRLQDLKPKLDAKSPKARIEFVTIVFKLGLYQDIITHSLMDNYQISGRDFDLAFEMHDGNVVVHGLMKEALNNPTIKRNIEYTGQGVWDAWLKTYQEVEQSGRK